MPELPEVETMRRGIAMVVGATIASIERTACPRKPITVSPRMDAFNRRIVGKKILSVDRLGKRVVIRLDSDDRIVLEPRMTGLVLIADPPTKEHLRLRICLRDTEVPEILFWDQRGLGQALLWSAAQYDEKRNDGSLGPDALEVDPAAFADRFRKSQREIKVALLDQSIVAGIGNLYASEILHLAGVNPKARCHRIGKSRWNRIYQAMREVLDRAIQHEGSTLSDGTYRNSLNQNGSYQNHHRVYDREGEICPTCGRTTVKRIVQAQRSTFYCPKCQR